jgi:pyruvate dehydrogenase E2 component (dihydrolipoamide acetyltransferase)
MYDITMPKLSDSMETGQIVTWRVREGEEVREGDVLAEIESDKAVMELECFHDGTLVEVLRGDGDEAAVGEVIARIAAKGEEATETGATKEAPAKKIKPPKKKPEKGESPPKKKPDREPEKKRPEKPPPPKGDAEKPDKGPAGRTEARRLAPSPYARKVAQELGVDLASVTGTGPGGRIYARDVEAAAKPTHKTTQPRESEPQAGKPGPAPRPDERAEAPARPEARTAAPSPDEELPEVVVRPGEASVEPAPFRLRTIARHVTASKHVIPHFYITRAADVTAVLERRAELKEKHGMTLTHVVMLACIKALRAHPDVNRSYDRGRVIRWSGIHVGLAVATDAGLTVAVLRDAQDVPAGQLAARADALVRRAREGKLSAEERRYPTFTLSNLGMFDVENFQPVIHPPGAMTLAVASAREAPVVRDGKVAVGRRMNLTLSCDHRIVDGVQAARFLHDLAALLEDPGALVG